MSCHWCSTPESQLFTYEIGCDRDKCIKCGRCVSTCHRSALAYDCLGFPKVIEGRCDGCGECHLLCPVGSVCMYGKNTTAEQVFKEIEKDDVFYFHSGGGVTFSGGEALMQPFFVAKVLELCAYSGIKGAIETSACVPWRNIEIVLKNTDHFYIDIKHMDAHVHQKFTGVSNSLVLENIRKLDTYPCNISVRIPVIPGVNDSLENIVATAEFCRHLVHLSEVELLPYHKLGTITYRKLGKVMLLENVAPPSQSSMLDIAKTIKSILTNIDVKISGGLV